MPSRLLPQSSFRPSESRLLHAPTVTQTAQKVLTHDSINPRIRNAQYAVRGELAIRAEELRKQLAAKPGSLPFSAVTNVNIGNPHQLGQKPATWIRQVLACVSYPQLLNDPVTAAHFPSDVVERARQLLAAAGGSVGAYSHSKGVPLIREHVAQFIEQRDGFPADPESIFLTSGASPGVQMVLQTIISNPNVGILIPIPQYPLYTASIAIFDGTPVPYYLSEETGWSLDPHDIGKAIRDARERGIDVRAVCVINPGNPTGSVLSRENIEQIIDIAAREKLVILADEVYQANVYIPESKPFHSFKKVLRSMGPDYANVELFSFHSISKGKIGECGLRGAYFEAVGIDPQVMEEIYKAASVNLCPSVLGQVAVDCLVNPPREGEPSYEKWKSETDSVFDSLNRRATKLAAAFNELTGMTCNSPDGALYLFPQVQLPDAAKAVAQQLDKNPDDFYCMELLNATGVCMVPGSGFGQKEGTLHFRSTFLPPEEMFDDFITRLKEFHEGFMSKYAS